MKRLFVIFLALALPCGMLFSQKKSHSGVHTVVIDPGHGGNKPGAIGSRSQEKAITLDIALKLGKLIKDNYPDVNVIFTRTTDVDISLAERAHIANRNKADLFISIHANSHPTSAPTGVETFVMGLSKSASNLEVAKKENADILLEADYKTNQDYAGFDPNSDESYIIFTMTQNAYLEKSLNFAQAIQTQYKNNIKTINRGVKQAELFVLYKTTCPSVLTEVGFISNPTEEAFMLSPEGQAKIAISLFNAFMNYKASEEGTSRLTNPVFNIKGYTPPTSAKPEPAKPVEIAQTEPSKPAEVVPTEPAKPVEPEPVSQPEQRTVTPQEKPTPTVTLPPQQPEPQPVATEEKPAPQPVAAEDKPTPKPEPKPESKTELQQPDNTADPSAKSYYTVQFLTIATLYRVGSPALEGIRDFQTFRQGKNYAYITGRFRTMQEAVAYSQHLKKATSFKDAWAYLYRVPANQQTATAATTEAAPAPAPKAAPAQPATTATKTNTNGLVYRIQFCTSKIQMKAGDPGLQGISDFRMTKSGHHYLYTTGNYSTFQDAQQHCSTIRSTTNFKDAYVIAIYNNERITIEQAQEIEQKQ